MDYDQYDIGAFKAGIYLHFKGNLYEADHLTRNSSLDGRLEIHYMGLQLTGTNEGPRHLTREFNEFLKDRVHEDGSLCTHDKSEQAGLCNEQLAVAPRFRYLGPFFKHQMLDAVPWK